MTQNGEASSRRAVPKRAGPASCAQKRAKEFLLSNGLLQVDTILRKATIVICKIVYLSPHLLVEPGAALLSFRGRRELNFTPELLQPRTWGSVRIYSGCIIMFILIIAIPIYIFVLILRRFFYCTNTKSFGSESFRCLAGPLLRPGRWASGS